MKRGEREAASALEVLRQEDDDWKHITPGNGHFLMYGSLLRFECVSGELDHMVLMKLRRITGALALKVSVETTWGPRDEAYSVLVVELNMEKKR